jgi:hypothetical protein
VSGYLICYALSRFANRVRGQAWLIGLLICGTLWLIVRLTIGQFLLATAEAETARLYQILIGYPGMLYVLAGSWLTQYYYQNLFARD